MNKTIYILWFQGFDNAPGIVHHCVYSWKYYNPDWTIHLLDNTNIDNYINLNDYMDMATKDLSYAAHSDIIRLCLLKTHGGLWVDSTTFCNKPLNEWLPKYTNQGRRFFAFRNPTPDRIISSWFLYSPKQGFIINTWWDSLIQYYSIRNTPDEYFWVHNLFKKIYETNNLVNMRWNNNPKLKAGKAHNIIKCMYMPITEEIRQQIDKKVVPVYKLDHHYEMLPYDKTFNVYYLFDTIPPLSSV